jgi:hypothetical protein
VHGPTLRPRAWAAALLLDRPALSPRHRFASPRPLRLVANAALAASLALPALDSAINGPVQLDLHSSEGSLLHETTLRSHLAYLAAEIDLAYAEPTAAEAAVFDVLARQAKAGEERLRTLMR